MKVSGSKCRLFKSNYSWHTFGKLKSLLNVDKHTKKAPTLQ